MNQRTLIIAEAGVNHNGSLQNALKLVEVASDAGADIVKFQTFKSEKVISKFAKKAGYQIANTKNAESQLDMVRKLELSFEDHYQIKKRCVELGIEFLSTAFDIQSFNFLVNEMKIKRIKIPSGEITNAPFVFEMAQSQLPVIVSTGMANLGDIENVLGVIALGNRHNLNVSAELPSKENFEKAYCSAEGQAFISQNVEILHCTTEYPAPWHEINLRVMSTLRSAFPCRIGYSDHSMGISVPIAAVALGATTIEKHFTLDTKMDGPDHKASLNPSELKEMIESIRRVEVALGHSSKFPTLSEYPNRAIARKSLVAAKRIEIGEIFSEVNITSKRSGDGISPMEYWNILGTKSNRNYQEDEPIY